MIGRQDVADACHQPAHSISDDMDVFVAKIVSEAQAGDQILVMSNGGFGGIH